MENDCPELRSAVLFWWRVATTVGVVVLGVFLRHYQQKLQELEEKTQQKSSKRKNSSNHNDFRSMDDVTNRSIIGRDDQIDFENQRRFRTSDDFADSSIVRQRIVKNADAMFNNSGNRMNQRRDFLISTGDHGSTSSNYQDLSKTLKTTENMAEKHPKTLDDPKMERSQIIVENPSHITRIDNQSVTDSKYRITKIITTVEVTLQPTGSYESSSVKVDTVSLEDVEKKKVEEKEEEKITFESSEETNNIKSMLEATNTHSVEEIVEKVVTLDSVSKIIREAGLESSNLIFGIDYTASNKYQGENSFNGKSLHAIETGKLNPYQQVISVLGKTLAQFANSGFIAGYGFGDAKTEDRAVFALKTETGFCKSFNEMLKVYNDTTPTVILSGPTNFAPLIYEAIKICKQVKTYHILVIVADGQVTNEAATRDAIVEACKYPLSIIVVGVGDGPWQMMNDFDESLPKRNWDNFTFVEFHKVTATAANPESAFAVRALIEIPDQYKKIKALGLLEKIQKSTEL